MAEIRLTRKQAEALGVDVSKGKHRQAKAPRARKPKRAYHTRCHVCGEEFFTEASEERHLIANKHARYENVL